MAKRAVAAAAALVLCSCASIVRGGGPEAFNVRSNPAGAEVKIYDVSSNVMVSSGRTPYVAMLAKSRGFFQGAKYKVTLEMPGYRTSEALVDTRVSGWYVAGNIVFGGLIGWLIVDPATGAMWTLQDEFIDVPLAAEPPPPPAPPPPAPAPAPQASARARPRIAVVDLASVPPAARRHMVPLN